MKWDIEEYKIWKQLEENEKTQCAPGCTELEIEGDHCLILDSEIEQLVNLKTIKINDCGLTEIPSVIFKLTNLVTLYLLEGMIKSIPKEIKNLKNLAYFSIDNNRVENIPDEFFELTNLLYASFSNNYLSQVPKKIKNLQQLKYLYLNQNLIKSFPKAIFKLKNLEVLSLANNDVNWSVPHELFNLKKLKSVDIKNCNLTDNDLDYIIQQIKTNTVLEKLQVSGFGISKKLTRQVDRLMSPEGIELRKTNDPFKIVKENDISLDKIPINLQTIKVVREAINKDVENCLHIKDLDLQILMVLSHLTRIIFVSKDKNSNHEIFVNAVNHNYKNHNNHDNIFEEVMREIALEQYDIRSDEILLKKQNEHYYELYRKNFNSKNNYVWTNTSCKIIKESQDYLGYFMIVPGYSLKNRLLFEK